MLAVSIWSGILDSSSYFCIRTMGKAWTWLPNLLRSLSLLWCLSVHWHAHKHTYIYSGACSCMCVHVKSPKHLASCKRKGEQLGGKALSQIWLGE